jgi:hypothetical protein
MTQLNLQLVKWDAGRLAKRPKSSQRPKNGFCVAGS